MLVLNRFVILHPWPLQKGCRLYRREKITEKNLTYQYFSWTSGLRLVGGFGSWEGRVEVYYNNIWGTVCDDFWDISDARVVCRQLGYSGAVSAPRNARFGAGTGQIWLDDVTCRGSESSIFYCRHNGWGIHDCGHRKDASVICSGGMLTILTLCVSHCKEPIMFQSILSKCFRKLTR